MRTSNGDNVKTGRLPKSGIDLIPVRVADKSAFHKNRDGVVLESVDTLHVERVAKLLAFHHRFVATGVVPFINLVFEFDETVFVEGQKSNVIDVGAPQNYLPENRTSVHVGVPAFAVVAGVRRAFAGFSVKVKSEIQNFVLFLIGRRFGKHLKGAEFQVGTLGLCKKGSSRQGECQEGRFHKKWMMYKKLKTSHKERSYSKNMFLLRKKGCLHHLSGAQHFPQDDASSHSHVERMFGAQLWNFYGSVAC